MLTQTQLSALHRAHRDERVLSAYVDGSIADPAGQRTWRLHVERAIKDLRSWLDDSARDEREDLDHCVGVLEEQLGAFDPTVGAPGWVAFITRSGLVDAHALPVQVPTRIVWSSGACLAPYLRALAEAQPVLVAVVDASRAELYRYQFGKIEKMQLLRAHHVMEPPSHMGGSSGEGFHPGTRGSTGADAAQQSLLEARDRMLKEAAERLTEIAGNTGLMLIGGIPVVAARLEELLSAVAPGRVMRLEHLDVHSSEAMIADAAKGGAAEWRDARDADRISAVVDRAGASGLGILGATATRNALAADSVHELFVTRSYLEDHPAEAESVVGAAYDQAAIVEELSGSAAELLDSFGGIGASLRFRPAQVGPSPSAQRADAERPERRRRPKSKSTT
jgi:hypothetical protein